MPLPDNQQECVGKTPISDFTKKPQPDRQPTAFPKAWGNVDSSSAEKVRGLPDVVVPGETGSAAWRDLAERRRTRHDAAVTQMQQELNCIAREMEASVLELQESLRLRVMESDEKSELLFEKIASDVALEGFSFEGLENLWNMIQQESSNRKKWVKAMDKSLKAIERSRAVKIADALAKYAVELEEISLCLAADVHKLINEKAMNINRALLGNERATAKLLFNLMKSELEKEKLHQLKWQERVKDWKLIRKNHVVQSFREFMAREEIQNPPAVKTEMENMMKEQAVLGEQRLRVLQHIGTLLPATHTKSEINEWYRTLENFNRSIDTHSVEGVRKLRRHCELVQGRCQEKVQECKMRLLEMNVCPAEDVEILHSDMLQMTKELKHRFEEELEHMDSDFKEMPEWHEQHCQGLYSCVQGASDLWDVHQLQLAQQEAVLQEKVHGYRWKQDNKIQMMKDDLDMILERMKMASCEEELGEYLENALSSLDQIRTRNETLKEIVMDEVMAYPKAILWELISYSISISQHLGVKEGFKQNLPGEIDSTAEDQTHTSAAQTGLEARSAQPRAQQHNHRSPAGPEARDSCQKPAGETNPPESQVALAQEVEKTEEEEDEDSIPHKSGENEHAEQGVSITQPLSRSSMEKSAEIATEFFSTAGGNTYTALEEAGKADSTESYFTKYEKEESLPMHLRNALLTGTVFVKLKERLRLCFFEHLEEWFAESLSNSFGFVAAKKEELNSIFLLHLRLHQQKQEEIQTNIYKARAAELSLHQEQLEQHSAVLAESLRQEKAEFLKFSDLLGDLNTAFQSRIRDLERGFLQPPVPELSASSSSSLQSELHNHRESVRVAVRSYQHHLEEVLGKLRGSNVDFLKSCRLFSEGGDFSSEEVNFFSKRVQKESKQIDSFESSVRRDVGKIESSCLEQATELIKQSEKKFASLSASGAFLEKVQRSLRQLRQQIKSEVANSNLQSVTLKSHLEKLQCQRDAYVHSAADQEGSSNQQEMALTSEELYDFAREVLKELKKRSQYLGCFPAKVRIPRAKEESTALDMDGTVQEESTALDKDGTVQEESTALDMDGTVQEESTALDMDGTVQEDSAPPGTDGTLEEFLAPAVQRESLRDESKRMVMGLDPEEFPVLNPSRMDTSVFDDLAITVIKSLAGFDPSKKSRDRNQDPSYSMGAGKRKLSDARKSSTGKSAAQSRKKSSRDETKPRKGERKSVPALSREERFQIFGKKPAKTDTFKGAIMSILWKGNNTLLCLGEEFYGEKKNPQVGMPKDLPDTFEHWAEMLRLKLLAYQRQADDYYNFCLREFRAQLQWFEEELAVVSRLVVESLFKEHEQKLSSCTADIQRLFSRQLQEWQRERTVHQRKLHYSLGHPNNSPQLEALCQEEAKRQKDQTDGVHLNTKMLQDCAAECAQSFFSALAALTEKLLRELDETITVDDVKIADTEAPTEKVSALIHRKQARPPPGASPAQQSVQRGRRSWPGIPRTTLPSAPAYTLCRGTASVSTAQTTLAHLAVVDARQAAYQKYNCKLEQMFAQLQEENAAELLGIQRWNDWWEESVRKIKRLYP